MESLPSQNCTMSKVLPPPIVIVREAVTGVIGTWNATFGAECGMKSNVPKPGRGTVFEIVVRPALKVMP